MRMKIIVLTKHFLSVMVYYKLNFIFTLGIPIVSIVYSMRRQIFHHPSETAALSLIVDWTAYMIVLFALMASGPDFIQLRENQFLKMMLFVTGNTRTILAARFLAQLIVLGGSLVVLDGLCAFLFQLSPGKLAVVTLAMVLIADPPIYALFLLFAVLPIRPETVMPIVNVLIFTFIALSWLDLSRFHLPAWLMMLINPMDYASGIGSFFLRSGAPADRIAAAAAAVLYLLVGGFSAQRIKILPVFRS